MEVLGWHSIRSVKWHVLQVAVREWTGWDAVRLHRWGREAWLSGCPVIVRCEGDYLTGKAGVLRDEGNIGTYLPPYLNSQSKPGGVIQLLYEFLPSPLSLTPRLLLLPWLAGLEVFGRLPQAR
jgi:hypothetical protein